MIVRINFDNSLEMHRLTLHSLDVFNTEAQPFKAPPAKPIYGDGTLAPTPTVPFPSQPDQVPVARISPCPALGDHLTNVVTEVIGIVRVVLGW